MRKEKRLSGGVPSKLVESEIELILRELKKVYKD